MNEYSKIKYARNRAKRKKIWSKKADHIKLKKNQMFQTVIKLFVFRKNEIKKSEHQHE